MAGSTARSVLGGDSLGTGTYIDWGALAGPHVPFHVSGVVSSSVAQVRVELNNSAPLHLDVLDKAGFPVSFYVAVLPFGSRPVAVVALDDMGNELERLDTRLALDPDLDDPTPLADPSE